MRHYWLSVCGAILITLGYLPVCQLHASSSVRLEEKEQIAIGNGAEPLSLDPHMTESAVDFRIQRDLFEGLVIHNNKGEIIPGQAESWDVSPDGRVYTFHIRKSALWSNGDPVTAGDFVNSWRRLVSPATASPYAWFAEAAMIENADNIIRGKLTPDSLGAEAVDDKIFRVTLIQPLSYFIKMLTMANMAPVHAPSIQQYGNNWTKPGKLVSNGAYVLNEWKTSERVVLKRNNKYWDDKNTHLEQVSFLPVSGVSELNRYKAGDIQLTRTIPIEHYPSLLKDRPEEVFRTPTLGTVYISLNTNVVPLDDSRVRRALSYAIDRNAITEKLLRQGQKSAYTFTPGYTDGFNMPTVPYQVWSDSKRISAAKELLTQAGYDNANTLQVELVYIAGDDSKRLAVVIASMWQKIGVRTRLNHIEKVEFHGKRASGDYRSLLYLWMADYNEPSTMLNILTSRHTSNDSRYSEPAYDRLIEKSRLIQNNQERSHYYVEAEQLLLRDMPVIPLFHTVNVFLMDPSVGGYPINNPKSTVYTKNLFRL